MCGSASTLWTCLARWRFRQRSAPLVVLPLTATATAIRRFGADTPVPAIPLLQPLPLHALGHPAASLLIVHLLPANVQAVMGTPVSTPPNGTCVPRSRRIWRISRRLPLRRTWRSESRRGRVR